MFDSLKHWFENSEDSQLFENADSHVIHVALAALLYHIIRADKVESDREIHLFQQIMKDEFSLSEPQAMSLYEGTKTIKSDLKSDLLTVKSFLKDNPYSRMELMSKLNQLIDVDGVDNDELTVFYETMSVIFPEVKC